jgi:aquaporin Z
MSLQKRAAAEFFGTFWLVFGGCGAAVISAAFPVVAAEKQPKAALAPAE